MNDLEQGNGQPLGLDVGTSRVVVARAKEKNQDTVVPAYDTELNAFLTLPYSKLAESLLPVSYTHLVRRGPLLDLLQFHGGKLACLAHALRIIRGATLCLVICWTLH